MPCQWLPAVSTVFRTGAPDPDASGESACRYRLVASPAAIRSARCRFIVLTPGICAQFLDAGARSTRPEAPICRHFWILGAADLLLAMQSVSGFERRPACCRSQPRRALAERFPPHIDSGRGGRPRPGVTEPTAGRSAGPRAGGTGSCPRASRRSPWRWESPGTRSRRDRRARDRSSPRARRLAAGR
jgi:hypothetical protein